MIQKLKKSVMKIKCFKWLFILISMFFLMQSCSSDSSSVAADLNIISMATIMNADTWPIPELSEEEALLVDSISKLEEYVNYRKAYQQLIKKTNSYFASLSSEELEELAKNGTDDVFLSGFMKKMKSRIDIKKEVGAVEKAGNDFDRAIAGLELTEAEKVALIIKRFK
ncbi:hypothetical protein [Bacteroides congonensis]